MSRIAINFNDVPLKVLPITPGVYEAEVVEAPEVMPTKNGNGTKVVVKLRIVNAEDEKLNGRQITDHISTKMETRIKRLCKSGGLEVGEEGVDTEDLAGKVVKIVTNLRTYQDNDTEETVEVANIKEYVVDEE